MTHPDPKDHPAEIFAQLAVELFDAPSLAVTAQTVVSFALQALDSHHAGLAVATRHHRLEIIAVTDPTADALYELEARTGEGPAVQALTDQTTVAAHDLARETRWPEWAEYARAAGIRSTLHIPMTTTRVSTGVLSLYSEHSDAFSHDDEAIAHLLAQHASVAVADARKDATLTQAIDARRLVGQALGVLMERFDIDEDRAFAILKRYSQDTNTKLREVAQQLIETRHLPS